MAIPPVARRVNVAALSRVFEIASVTVMVYSVPSFPVCTVTLVPMFRASLICVFCTLATPEPSGVKTSGFPPEKDPLASAPVVMVILCGSNSHKPALPCLAEAFTAPKACRLLAEDVSTKPPFPPFLPPSAVMSPKKAVYSSDQRITRPPSPFTVASVRISVLGAITTALALGTSRFFPR